MRTIKFLPLILLLFIMTECLPKSRQLVKTFWEKGDNRVALVEFKDDPLAPYAHPTALSPEQMARALGALEYQQIAFFSWGKPKAIFEADEIELLGGLLNEALSEAGPKQVAEFCLSGRRTELIFPKSVLTCGLAFFKDGELHFVFSPLLREEEELEDEVVPNDPRKTLALKQKRIANEPPVSYPPQDPQNPLLEKPHTNWAVVDMEQLEKIEVESDIAERLKKLQELFEKGLITEEEYEQKKKEILEEL